MAELQLPARFQNRQSRRAIAAAVVTGLGSATPPYVSIKGGAFTLVDQNGEERPVETKHLDCVIFDANAEVAVQRTFWGLDERGQPKQYDDSGKPPVCFSDNGIGASTMASEPQSAHCSTCPMKRFDWVSKMDVNSRSSACRPTKKIVVLVPGLNMPFLLRVPVMSHENLRVYSDRFNGQEFDVSDVITRVTFVHGAVGQLDFQALGFTDDATEATIQKVLASKVTDAMIGRGDQPIQAMLPPSTAQIAQVQQRQEPARPLPAPSAAFQSTGTEQQPQSVLPATGATPSKRTRKPASALAATTQQSDENGIPPFLRRAASESQGNGAQRQGGQTGIVTDAPPPNAQMEEALQNVFGLKT